MFKVVGFPFFSSAAENQFHGIVLKDIMHYLRSHHPGAADLFTEVHVAGAVINFGDTRGTHQAPVLPAARYIS